MTKFGKIISQLYYNNSIYVSEKKNKKTNVLWTPEEKQAVIKNLGSYLSQRVLPGKMACERCIEKSRPVLDKRNWKVIKYFIRDAKKRAKNALGNSSQVNKT